MPIYVVTTSQGDSHFVEAPNDHTALLQVGGDQVRLAQGPEITQYYEQIVEKENS
jgi:hypothetical protein